MGRTIDLDAALDALTDYCENKCVIREYEWCPDCQYKAFKDTLKALPSTQPEQRWRNDMNDLISRQAAIDALWNALYRYEDKTEKQFIESNELDVDDWMQHIIFVQNMNDIDRQTILNLPSAQAWMPLSEPPKEEQDEQKN